MLNEFRQDLVSGEWVLLATGRGKRSDSRHVEDVYQSAEGCPFENPVESGQEIAMTYPDDKNWKAVIIKNKYPALKAGACGPDMSFGPFKTHAAVGDHEVVIYKNHERRFDEFTPEEITDAVRVYKKRYLELSTKIECTQYILIFHNHGAEAGASIYHPHSQIITMPILPPDVSRSIYGSYDYYKQNNKRVYDVILEWEMAQKTRIVYENSDFVVFCPFVSKYPYELRIFPKISHAHFEQMPENKDSVFADALYTGIQKIRRALGKPAFNFFIHTAPLASDINVKMHEFYTWHVEIIPHVKIDAGFEIGTGVEINVIDPDEAAAILKNVKI